MIFEGRHHGHGFVVIVGRADAIKTRLAGNNLEKDPAIVAAPVGGDDLAILDGEWWKTVGPVSNLLCGGDRELRKRGSG
jgi:hypothetical protein